MKDIFSQPKFVDKWKACQRKFNVAVLEKDYSQEADDFETAMEEADIYALNLEQQMTESTTPRHRHQRSRMISRPSTSRLVKSMSNLHTYTNSQGSMQSTRSESQDGSIFEDFEDEGEGRDENRSSIESSDGRDRLSPANKASSSTLSYLKGSSEHDQSALRSKDYSKILHPLPKEVAG